jgi:N-acetylmuramoyl-L-alanine amidase
LPKLTLASGLALAGLLLAGLPACGLAASAAPGASGQALAASHRPSPTASSTARAARHVPPPQRHRARRHRAAGPAAARQARPLAGKIIGIDPGHNGRNYTDPGYLNHRVWNGREWEACDTTGTSTDNGYTEPRFTFRVARFLRDDLASAGARVVMTRTDNHGIGPCVNRRAKILNRGHADVAIDIHADGGPAWGRGFSILEPVPDGPNNKIIATSLRFARDVRRAVRQQTPMPVSNYYGHHGLQPRDDLAGLNLATEPKVLIESGNMRNGADARLLTSASFQRQLAKALAAAIAAYLTGR